MNWNYVSESVDGAIGAAKATKGYKQFNACINADKKKKKDQINFIHHDVMSVLWTVNYKWEIKGSLFSLKPSYLNKLSFELHLTIISN